MNEPKSFRHELKYNITDAQLALIRSRIDHLLPPDSHTGDTGAYTIRSLYFDDYDNRCFLENEDGTDPREKFRIRYYNEDLSFITLEKKLKHNDPYILVTICTDENAESAVMDIIGKEAAHCVVKSKTVATSGIELTAELRTKTASTAFVNAIAQLPGVETATLVSYNGEYLS